MELKEYLKILRQNFVFILTISAAAALLAVFATRYTPSGFQQSQTFFLSQADSEPGNLPKYYAQEKARNFTDTAVAILDSPDFKREIESPGEQIAVRKIAPQVVRITATGESRQNAESLMIKTANLFNSKLTILGQNRAEIQLKEIGTPRESTRLVADKKVFAIAGFVLGMAAAIAAISLKAYFKL